MAQRLIGQDVSLTTFVGTEPQDAITDVRSFSATFQTEIIKSDYLGSFTDRRANVFRGVRGSMEYHFSSAAALSILAAIVERCRNRRSQTRIVTQATLLMPNGDRPMIVFDDQFFENIPLDISGRTEFGSVKLDWESDDARFVGI